MNVHDHSRPHKKDYGVLLGLQACSYKAARLGVATAPMQGQKRNFLSAQCHIPSYFHGNHGGLVARAPGRELKDPIEWTDCSSQLSAWASRGLSLPVCDVGVSFSHFPEVVMRATWAKPLLLRECD